MHRIAKFIFILSIFMIAAGFPVVAHAAPVVAPVHQEAAPVIPSLPDLFESLKNLGGLALFFSAAFNAAKSVGWMKDAQAPTANLIFNTLTLVTLVVLQLSGRADIVPVIDQSAGILATIITSVFALFYQLWVSRQGHEKVLAGLPVVGYSFSGRKAGAAAENQVLEITNIG